MTPLAPLVKGGIRSFNLASPLSKGGLRGVNSTYARGLLLMNALFIVHALPRNQQ